MSDAEILRYKRELERNDRDPRTVAAGLLGADPERFLLLCNAAAFHEDETLILRRLDFRFAPNRMTIDAPVDMPVYASQRMTGVEGDGAGGETWVALHAFPVVAVQDFVDLSRHLAASAGSCTLWDTTSKSRATSDGQAWLRVESGWRSPRNRRAGMLQTQVLRDVVVRGVVAPLERRARVNVFANAQNEITVLPEREGAPMLGVGTNWRADPAWAWPVGGPAPVVRADVEIMRTMDVVDGLMELNRAGGRPLWARTTAEVQARRREQLDRAWQRVSNRLGDPTLTTHVTYGECSFDVRDVPTVLAGADNAPQSVTLRLPAHIAREAREALTTRNLPLEIRWPAPAPPGGGAADSTIRMTPTRERVTDPSVWTALNGDSMWTVNYQPAVYAP